MGEKSEDLFLQAFLFVLAGDFFTCSKILQHGASSFHPKEGVLQIFISLKNPLPQPGSKPQHLGPMAGTLTITSR
jgi:hypothetical protein